MRAKKFLPFVIAAVLLLSAIRAFAQEGKEMTPEQQKMMELMMKYGTPGEGHKLIEPFVGDWNVANKWWPGPEAPAQESQATSKIVWILDRHYIQETVEGLIEGMPFKGTGIVGFDNYTQKYNSLWIDNMSTMFFLQTGTANKDGSVITMEGTYDDYMTGQKEKKSKTVIKLLGHDKRVVQMYDVGPDGKEYISMELTYTRKM